MKHTQQKTHRPAEQFFLRRDTRRGHTIVLIMMMLTLLSGLGILAMNNVTIGIREASLQRLSAQAFGSADASLNLLRQYAGANGRLLIQSYNNGYDKNKRSSNTDLSREDWAFYVSNEDAAKMIFQGATVYSPFSNTEANSTWERNRVADYRLVMRDLVDGLTATGYSGNFCFKRVLMGGEGTVGFTSTARKGNTTYASAITGQEALIGPVRCGNSQ